MELCGQPALTDNHSNVGPLIRTLNESSVSKISRSPKTESKIPIDLSMNISPLCYTLSRILDISRTRHEFKEWDKHQKL